ncbi:hypothetical protein ACPXCP_39965 [Streptomyces sp. DT20]|uniref:hypothetical protein n=1 Tax=Streptomyces sp. DT20 TaxID=3416519 RepID=UPI003CEFD1A4
MPQTDPNPEDWRDLLRSWNYPDDTRTGTRRQRRQARDQHRQDVRRRSADWIRAERQRDPIRPAGALLAVVLILAIGAAARYYSAPSTAPSPAAVQPAAPDRAADDKPPAPSTPTPATAAPAPGPVDMTDPDTVAEAAIRHYLTRNPPVDGDHTASVRRAEPYLTRSLALNLTASSDPAYGRLVSRGGVATVGKVTVRPAGNSLPVDTPLRVWRTVTAIVDVTGYEHYSETVTVRTEAISTGTEWRVSRILDL